MTDEVIEPDDDAQKRLDDVEVAKGDLTADLTTAEFNLEAPLESIEPVVVAEVIEPDSSEHRADADSHSDAGDVYVLSDEEIQVAEVVPEETNQGEGSTWAAYAPPPIPKQFQNLAANGGAVATLALGAFAIVGAFFSDVSAFNAMMGLCFGFWGATSNLKRTNTIGIVCCVVALGVCMVN